MKGKQIIMKRKQKRSQARIHIKNQINRRVIIRRGFCGWWVKDSSKIWYQMVFYCLYWNIRHPNMQVNLVSYSFISVQHNHGQMSFAREVDSNFTNCQYVEQNLICSSKLFISNTFPLNLVEAGFFDQRRFHSSLILQYYNNHFHSNIIYIFLHIYYIQLIGN